MNTLYTATLTIQAERDFSVKKALEAPRKTLAGPDYFFSAMFTACNKKHLMSLVTGPTDSRSEHFAALLKRARVEGRGLTRTACRSDRKRRRRIDADRGQRPIIDMSSDDDALDDGGEDFDDGDADSNSCDGNEDDSEDVDGGDEDSDDDCSGSSDT